MRLLLIFDILLIISVIIIVVFVVYSSQNENEDKLEEYLQKLKLENKRKQIKIE